jgi:hypothetical protein
LSIVDTIKQGLQIARRHRSLWLFAFFVGLTGNINVSSNGGGGAQAAGHGPGLPVPVIVACGVIVIVAMVIMKFVSEGALIEGVTRAHRNASLSIREGFRVGWAHWGVLFRIAAIFAGITIGSLLVLAVPCVIALRAFGREALVVVAIPTVVVAVPWVVTLYALQSLASRIAVLDNRRALDAIAKARLFLHGRIGDVLKLMVAAFVGTLLVALAGLVVIGPVVLLLVAAAKLLGMVAAAVIGAIVLVPAVFVLVAFMGTVQSAAWTLGYLTHTERGS